jgi:hypothetical protein
MPRSQSTVRRNLELLPLFAREDQIGAALLGAGREKEWRQIAPLLEARGMPKVDQLMGGRYVRAVVEWFDQQYGLSAGKPLAPDGVEDFDTWKAQKRKRPA